VALLLSIAVFTKGFNRYWFWLPLVWALEIVFVCGLALLSAALNVFVRDTRYIVESATWVLLFLVPVFYDSNLMPVEYRPIYDYNPIAATVISLRKIVYEAQPPVAMTLWKMLIASLAVFLAGMIVFRRMKPMFYEHI